MVKKWNRVPFLVILTRNQDSNRPVWAHKKNPKMVLEPRNVVVSFCKRSNFHVSWGDKLVPLIVIDCNLSLWKALFEDFGCANAIPPRRRRHVNVK